MYVACLINAVSLIFFLLLLDPEIHSVVEMIPNGFSRPELPNCGQKLNLALLFVIFGFQIFSLTSGRFVTLDETPLLTFCPSFKFPFKFHLGNLGNALWKSWYSSLPLSSLRSL